MTAIPALVPNRWCEPGVRREVFEILKASLLSDDAVPVSKAAADLRSLFDKTSDQTSQSLPLLTKDFFIPAHAIACHLPHQGTSQDRLVAIVIELRDRSFEQYQGHEQATCAWVEQPFLEEAFAEVYDEVIYTTVPGLSADQDAAHRINFHSYAARLTQAGLLLNDKYCIFAFADALEGQYSERMMPESVEDPSLISDVALRIIIVTEWIRNAAQAIYSKDFSVWGEVHGPLVTWEEEGFSENRWKLWKSRLSMVEMSDLPAVQTLRVHVESGISSVVQMLYSMMVEKDDDDGKPPTEMTAEILKSDIPSNSVQTEEAMEPRIQKAAQCVIYGKSMPPHHY
ncbi:hypothetical protein KEM54_006718 [Ascosphaera aggregata]|nr:hypothetical protein KEM54_006718 [Ascosphaera aggregata]